MHLPVASEAPSVFRYSVFTHLMAGLFHIFVPLFGYWLWRRQGWNWYSILSIPAFPALVWEWWGGPNVFLVENGKLTVRRFWGRERSWRVSELTIPGAGGFWTLASSGYCRVRERNGRRAFNVSAHLTDFADFVEIIEPGSRAKREARDPNSWWNRELFK